MANTKNKEPLKVWKRLKIKVAQLIQELQKLYPLQKATRLIEEWQKLYPLQKDTLAKFVHKINGGAKMKKVWIKKDEGTETNMNMGKFETNMEKSYWDKVSDHRVSKLSNHVENLAEAISGVLEQVGVKNLQEVNRTCIKDDQAPMVAMEWKIKKQQKPIKKVTLDKGVGVSLMSKKWYFSIQN